MTVNGAVALVGLMFGMSPTVVAPPPVDAAAEAKAAQALAADPQAIRRIDVKALIASPLGWAATDEVVYADLTGDGKEEVIVPLATGGSAADRAVAVYGFDAAGFLRPLLIRRSEVGHLQFKVDAGTLTISEPRYAAGEPNCCPGQMTFTRYAWNGKQLVEKSHRTEKVKK